MKNYTNALGLLILVMCGSSLAQTNNTISATSTTSTSNASQSTVATGTATNQGNAQSITFTSPSETRQSVDLSGTQTIKNVPSMNAPPLVSSNDTCMGSASGSASTPGFGISIGKTYTDENCVLLKNSRELWNMGMKAAALARMCMNSDNKTSLELTGFECPQTTRDRKGNDQLKMSKTLGQSTPKPFEPTDPIIRQRLGLPIMVN